MVEYLDKSQNIRRRYGLLTWTQAAQVAVGASSTKLLDAGTTRHGIRLQNVSDTPIDVSLDGTAAVTTDGIRLYAGDVLELYDYEGDDVTLAFYAITSDGSSTKNVRVFTGV